MSYSFMTSSWGAKNGLLNQSKAEQFGLDINTRGNSSTMIGYSVPFQLAGVSNTIIGFEAAVFAPSGNNLLFLGTHTGQSNRADGNIFIGNRTGQFSRNGFNLIYIGHDSGRSNDDNITDVFGSIHVGHASGNRSLGRENIFIGHSNNATSFPLRTTRNTSVGAYNLQMGCNNVQVGYSNFTAGEFNTTIGYMIENSNNNNSIVVGRNIKNYGSNSVILKTNQLGTFENFKHNLINIQDVIVGSNTANGGYVLKFQTDKISLETSDGNNITLGGNSNSVVAQYYSITAEQFDIAANTTFARGTIFNGRVTTNDQLIVNGTATFNDNVLFTAPSLTITSAVNMNSNVNIRGVLDVSDPAYFKDITYFTNQMVVAGFSTFCNDIDANKNVIVGDNLFVKNGTGTFCNNIIVKGVATFDGIVNMTKDVIFDEDVQVSRNLAVYGHQTVSCNLDVEGTFVVEGVSTHQSDLFVNGNGFFQKNVNIDSNLTVDGSITACNAVVGNLTIANSTFALSNNVQIGGSTEFRNTVTFSSNAFFPKTATFESNAIFTANFNAQGTNVLSGSTTLASNTFVRDNFVSTATSTFCNASSFKSLTKFEGQVVLSNITYTYGPTTFFGVASFSNDTHADKFSVSDMTCCNTARFIGTTILSSNTVIRDTLTSVANATFCNAANFKSTTLMEGPVTMSNSVAIYGPTTFYSAVNVPFVEASDMNLKTLTVSCNTVLDGFTRIRNPLVIEGETTFSNTIINKAALFQDGVTTLSNNLFVYGNAILYSSTTASLINASNINANSLVVSSNTVLDGSIRVRGNTVFENTSTFCNNTAFLGEVDFSNDVRFTDTVLSRSLSVSNVTITENAVINGNTFINGGVLTTSVPATFCNTLALKGSVFLSNSIDVSGDISAKNNLYVVNAFSSNLVVKSLSATSNTVLDGPVRIRGPLTTEDVVHNSNKSYFYDEARFLGAAHFSNSLYFYGTSYAASTQISNLMVSSSALFNGTTTVQGSLNISGVSTLSNDVSMFGTLIQRGRTLLSNELVVYDATTLRGVSASSLTAINATVSSNFIVDGTTTVKGPFLSQGVSTFCNSTTFHDNIFVNDNADFYGTTVFHGPLKAEVVEVVNITDFFLESSNIDVKSIVVDDSSILKGDTTVQDRFVIAATSTFCNVSSFLGKVTFSNDVDFYGNNRYFGTTSFSNILSSNITSSGGITTTGGTTVLGGTSIKIGAPLMIENNATFCNNVVNVGSLEQRGVATFTSNISMSGPLTALDASVSNATVKTLSILNQSILSGNTIVSGDFVVNSTNTTFCNLTNFVGKVSISNDIDVFGTTKLLGTTNISTLFSSNSFIQTLTSSSNTLLDGFVRIRGNLVTEGDTTFSNNITSWGNLTQRGVAAFSNDVVMHGLTTINNLATSNATIKSIVTQQSALFSGLTTIKDNLLIDTTTTTFCNTVNNLGKVTFSNDIDVYGTTRLLGSVSLTTVSSCNIVANSINISSNAVFDGTLRLRGTTSIEGTTTFCNNTFFTNNTVFSGQSTFSNKVSIFDDLNTKNVYVGSNLFVVDDVEIGKNLDVFGMTTFNNDVFFQDAVVLQARATLSNNVDVFGTLDVKGPLLIDSSNLMISGTSIGTFIQNTVGGSVSTTGNAVFSNLQVSGAVTFNNSNSISIGGCNLLYYLNKVEALSSGSGSSNVTSSNVTTSNISASNISTSNITACNIVTNTNNTFTLTASNIVATSNITQSLDAFIVNASNISMSGGGIAVLPNIVSNVINASNVLGLVGTFNTFTASNILSSNMTLASATFSNVFTSNIQVQQNSLFMGNSNVFAGNVTISNDLTVGGSMNFSNLAVTGNASFCNMVYLKESNVVMSDCNMSFYTSKIRELADIINFDDSNIAALSNDIIANANTVLMDDVHIESNLYIGGNIIVKGLTCMNNVKLTNITLFNGIDCTGTAFFRAHSVFYDDITLCNDLFVGSHTSLAGNLLVNGQSYLNRAIIEKNLQVGCNMTVGSNLTVAGALNVNGGLNLSSNVTINGSLSVVRTTTLQSNVNVNGLLSVNRQSTFTSNVSMLSTLTASNIIVQSNLNVSGNSIFNGIITATDKIILPRSSNNWEIKVESNSTNFLTTHLVFESQRNTRVVFSDEFETATFNFTGTHRCSMCNVEKTSFDEKNYVGKIVVSMGVYNNLQNSSKIDIDEAVPVVALAKNANDTSAFGVVAGFEEKNSDNRYFKIGNLCFNHKKNLSNRKVVVNAVGEGGIWVCDAGGALKNGDLITTSGVAGYGMKQQDDMVRSYTVAKITCDCTFDVNSTVYECVEFQHEDGLFYKKAFVGCVYKF